jgi:hypothetical protein
LALASCKNDGNPYKCPYQATDPAVASDEANRAVLDRVEGADCDENRAA